MSETDITTVETSGEATASMVDEMASTVPTCMIPFFGGASEGQGAVAGGGKATRGQPADSEKKKEKEAKKQEYLNKIAEKAAAEEAQLVATMTADPPAYVAMWQKAVIADLGNGTTLVENLALQDLLELLLAPRESSNLFTKKRSARHVHF